MNELKANKEAIMIKAKLTLSTLALLLSVSFLSAEPISNTYTNVPEPVYGMDALENNTIYPSIAQDMGNDGYVLLRFHVDKVGNVSNISVTQSGGAVFDQAAIDAVQKTDWNPAMQNGTAIAVTFEIPFEFYSK